jgi:flagellar biosynthesis protein FlhG
MAAVMTKTVADQADGLRRLMARDRGRLVAVVGSHPGAGATSLTLNVAMALWQQGQDVVVLDEHGGPGSAWATCSVPARATWSEVAAGRMSLAAGAGCAWGALPVLSADPDRTAAGDDPRRVLPGRIALVDARPDAEGGLSPLAREADDIVVVLQPQFASLKAAYTCIKALHHAHAVQQLHVLLTQVGDADEAQHFTRNLALTGSRYLAVSVQNAGCISADPRLPHAQRLGLGMVQAFPAAPAASELRRIATDLLHWPLRNAHPLAAAA